MAKARDPICGKEIDKASAASRISYLGHTYYFCSEKCSKAFKATPQEVMKKASVSDTKAASHPRP